jgi:hypothetical protein
MLTCLSKWWENDAWVDAYRISFTYDASDNILTFLFEMWNSDAWVNDFRVTYTYDASGNELTCLEEYWTPNEGWTNSLLDTYTYDASGNMLTYVIESWENDTWENGYRESYTYDNYGNSVSGIFEIWENDNWEPGFYDGTYFVVFCNHGSVDIEIGSVYRFEASFVAFENNIANTFEDNHFINVYPNPASDKLNICLDKEESNGLIRIYTSMGSLIKTVPINQNTSEISVSDLNAGIYIVEFSSKKEAIKKKLIINR